MNTVATRLLRPAAGRLTLFRARTAAALLSAGAAVVAALMPAAAVAAPIEWIGGTTVVATGGGERGPWRQNASRYDYVDDPTVAIDSHGAMLVAWVDQAAKAVLFRRFGFDGSAGSAVTVSRSPETFSWLPRIAIAPDRPANVHLLWQEIIFSGGSHGGDILYAGSQDGGATFSVPVNLTRSVGGEGKGRLSRDIWDNGSLDLVASPGGTLSAAWTDYEGRLWFSRSTSGGASFSPPRPIAADASRPARGPSLAVGNGEVVHLAWTVGEDAAADIRIATSNDAGANFDAPRLVGRSHAFADAPKLAFGRDGVLHIVYSEAAGGPFGRSVIRHARAFDGRRFEAARIISTPLPAQAGSAGFPSIAIDAIGRIHVTWELFGQRRNRPRGLGITVSADGGTTFSTPMLVPDSIDAGGGINGSQQGLLMNKLAAGGDGNVAIVNSSFAPGAGSRVWLIRGRTG